MEGRGKYQIPGARYIIKTSLLYHDRKTNVPKRVVELLGLTPGQDQIVWVAEGNRIYVESPKQAR